MRRLLIILSLLVFNFSFAQHRKPDFDAIDRYVQTISHPAPDSLAFKLTERWDTDLEKMRAIFSWIAQNIGYKTRTYSSAKNYSKASFDPLDTMTIWKTGDEMTAMRILHRRVAVCEGFSRLFKVLCDYAGLKSELVFGYARNGMGRSGFRCNHTWNVVMIDSVWRPIDVTWASGYINYRNEYVHEIDENYFLPKPQDFIRDHYPEDLRWALLTTVPFYREFEQSPFRYKCFDKYLFTSFPKKGDIEAAEGDTIRIELKVKDAKRDKQVSSNPFFDSTIVEQSPHSAFLYPVHDNNKIIYTYIIADPSVQWLHLFYNNDLVLRYHLSLKGRDKDMVK
jgi:hypothetical protein